MSRGNVNAERADACAVAEARHSDAGRLYERPATVTWGGEDEPGQIPRIAGPYGLKSLRIADLAERKAKHVEIDTA